MNIDALITENKARLERLHEPYDPLTGVGSPVPRFGFPLRESEVIYLPEGMRELPLVEFALESGSLENLCADSGMKYENVLSAINNARYDYDFEYWAATTIKIEDKLTLQIVPFILRRAQRKLLWSYEKQRLSGKPIRTIVCKARQWGGSTLTQIYMMWIQQRLKKNWHSAICAHLDDIAKHIRGMYDLAASVYPASVGTITLKPHQKTQKNLICKERGCIIGVGSVESPDQFRGYNYPMIHMSEVGLYSQTAKKNANSLAQSLRSTIPNVPLSLIVMESTAKGRGNFFHEEWEAAEQGRSSYDAVFVPWFQIDIYENEIEDYAEFIHQIDNSANREYYWALWEMGATLEGIKWYINTKAGENYSDLQMFQEYPCSASEAFSSTGNPVFSPFVLAVAEKSCLPPVATGRLSADEQKGKKAFSNLAYNESPTGSLWVWQFPDKHIRVSNRYVVIADIGGKTAKADYSTIRVLDRYWMMDGGVPESVATWQGHLDQDLFAWVCAQVACWYNNALLVIESNSLRKDLESSEGSHFLTILDEIAKFYPNLYARTPIDKIRSGLPVQYGFHTNTQTKPMVINALNAALRDSQYVERDARVIAECSKFEQKSDGSMGATSGAHDDLVMATAIGVWASASVMPMPVEITSEQKMRTGKKHRKLSSF